MRLINTTTLELKEFNLDEFNYQEPFGYAILSHRWRDDEVDFKDLNKKRKTTGSGYSKIVRCCQFARSRGFSWALIDTCCIDKRSSSELSEAINSMFRIYSSARECYAFLDDVTLRRDDSDLIQVLHRSEWFSRGWTLQELIAPKAVIFMSADWSVIGRKSWKAVDDFRQGERSRRSYSVRGSWHSDRWPPNIMANAMRVITRVPEAVLLGPRRNVFNQSIADKMSWMAGRNTTRIEDQTYCMLGLFGINMPLLYGEGLKAFDRFQALLLQGSSDETIFAWDVKHRDSWRLLAQRPGHFALSTSIQPAMWWRREPYYVSNQGLRFEFKRGQGVEESVNSDGRRVLDVQLNCTTTKPGPEHLCWMHLEQATCGHFIRRQPRLEDASSGDGARWDLLESGSDDSYSSMRRKTARSKVRSIPVREESYAAEEGPTAAKDSSGEVVSDVIFIHMGQEHHMACRVSSGDKQTMDEPLMPRRKRPRC